MCAEEAWIKGQSGWSGRSWAVQAEAGLALLHMAPTSTPQRTHERGLLPGLSGPEGLVQHQEGLLQVAGQRAPGCGSVLGGGRDGQAGLALLALERVYPERRHAS